MFGEMECQGRNKSVFFRGRLEQPGRTIHFQLPYFLRSDKIYRVPKCCSSTGASLSWVGICMHCPPGPVLIMFFFLLLQSANLNLLLWGEQEEEGGKNEGF